jgi:RNA-directed DNA polymerase
MKPRSYFNIQYLTNLYNDRLSESKTKGIDKLNALNIQNVKNSIGIIKQKVLANEYKFTPYLEVLKLKGRNKSPRIISIPTLRDRIILLALKELLHNTFPECVNTKRPNRYIREIKEEISKPNIYFLKVDIEHFYDKINREFLLEFLSIRIKDKAILNLISNAISTPSVPANAPKLTYHEFKNPEGVPQGLSISNILAQIYLYDLDGIINKRKYFYRRYVDDILILNEGEISSFKLKNIKQALSKIHLNINEEKTSVGKLENGFTFLSYRVTENKISISEKNIQVFIRRIAAKFTWFKNCYYNKNKRPEWITSTKRLKEIFIEELNESITGMISSRKNYGWLFYFSEINDLSLLFKLDKIIQSFFSKLDAFDNKSPSNLKKLTRAYHVMKFDLNKNYICNYDKYDTVRRKRSFLISRGAISPTISYTDMEIGRLFTRYTLKQIKYIEKDVGYRYF